MRRRRQDRGALVLTLCFAVSGIIHGLLYMPAQWAMENFMAAKPRDNPPVKVVRLSADAWNRSLSAARQARKRSPLKTKAQQNRPKTKVIKEKKKPEPKNDNLKGQVVEVPPTADDSPNPEAKYLSKHNSNVKKETVARVQDRDSSKKRVTNKLQDRNAAPKQPPNAPPSKTTPTPTPSPPAAAQKPSQGTPGQEAQKFVLEMPDLKKKQEKLELKLPDLPGLAPNMPRPDPIEQAVKGNSERMRLKLGKGNAENGAESVPRMGNAGSIGPNGLPSLASLRPTLGTVARISGSPSRDYVEGVPEGDGTFLNTKQFKYATFFYRVRDSVAPVWEDMISREYRRRDPTGSIYGVRDRMTMLTIRLDPDGRLTDVRVARTSGVDFLDDVAVQAFKTAEPFPNPPAGIVDADGSIRFSFGFTVTMRPRGLNPFR